MFHNPELYSRISRLIDRQISDQHPAVRLQASSRLNRLWEIDRDGFWERLNSIVENERNIGVLKFFANGIFGKILHHAPARISEASVRLYDRFKYAPEKRSILTEGLSNTFCILWISYDEAKPKDIIDTWIDDFLEYKEELHNIIQNLRSALIYGLGETENDTEKNRQIRTKSTLLAQNILSSISETLENINIESTLTDTQKETFKQSHRLLDSLCNQLRFAIAPINDNSRKQYSLYSKKVFLEECEALLFMIGKSATPNTLYTLLQIIEVLVPANPEKCFDLMTLSLTSGGKTYNFQHESLGLNIVVKLIGFFLADHKYIFEDEVRRKSLIDCLDLFVNSGWPAAQRLLYDLPDLLK